MTTVTKSKKTAWNNYFLGLGLMTVAMLAPEMASATTFDSAICGVVNLLNSNVAKAIGTVAVITLGLGALLGRVAWGQVVLVTVGIAAVLTSGWIIDTVFTSGGSACAA